MNLPNYGVTMELVRERLREVPISRLEADAILDEAKRTMFCINMAGQLMSTKDDCDKLLERIRNKEFKCQQKPHWG
jgi:hypothetical protein